MTNGRSKSSSHCWIDKPLCRLTHLSGPGFVLQDHLRPEPEGKHTVEEIIIDDQAALRAYLDFGTIPSLLRLQIKGHHRVTASEFQSLVRGFPNLRELSILNMKVIGAPDSTESAPTLPLQRLVGPVSVLALLTPLCQASLESLDIHLDMNIRIGDVPPSEATMGAADVSASLSQCQQLHSLRLLCGSDSRGYAIGFLASLPLSALPLLRKLEINFYFTARRTMVEEIGSILRNKLPVNCSLVLSVRPEEMTNYDIRSSDVDSLKAAVTIFHSYFQEVLKPLALTEGLPLREVRTMNYFPVSGIFSCVIPRKEWCLVIDSESENLMNALEALGRKRRTILTFH
ncbi:hypothetical protein FRC17_005922 [Serendipita sp. 399]|nr:hypothetical protein FRC17_005922 [Serendipita sp. 399]